MKIIKLLRPALFLVMLLAGVQSITAKHQVVEVDGFKYILFDDMTASVLQYSDGSLVDIVIPAEVTFKKNKYSVTSIGVEAFSGRRNLSSITLPNTITTIEEEAFYECFNLKSIKFPDNLLTIGNKAFSRCWELKSVSLPNTVTTIGDEAFAGCSKLNSVNLPDSIKSISPTAFYGCYKLYDNPLLKPYWQIVASRYIRYEFNSDGTATVVRNYSEEAVEQTFYLKIPETVEKDGKKYTVTKIDNRAFSSYENLRSVIIGDSVKEIGSSAFSYDKNLKEVILSSSLSIIEDNAFYEAQIETIELPNTLKEIGKYAFYKNGLMSVSIPESVTILGSNAFEGCAYLTSVTINGELKEVGKSPFWNCLRLSAIKFPNVQIAVANKPFYTNLGGRTDDTTFAMLSADGKVMSEAKKPLGELAKTPTAVKGRFYWKKDADGKEYLVNEAGKTVLPASAWDSVWFRGNAIVIKKKGKFGVYSYSGARIVAPLYDKYEGCGAEGRLLFSNNLVNGSKLFVYSNKGVLLAFKEFTNNQPYSVASWMKQWIPMFMSF